MQSHGEYQALPAPSFYPFVDFRPIKMINDINKSFGELCTLVTKCCPGAIKKVSRLVLFSFKKIVVDPINDGLTAFFIDRNRQWRWTKPLGDALMWVPGNALIALAHAVLPINGKGGWGVPFIPTLSIGADIFLLIRDSWIQHNTFNRIRNPIAGIVALFFGSMGCLSSMSTMVLYFEDGVFDFTFNPADCLEIIGQNHLTLLQKCMIATVGYVAALNGIFFGRNWVLYQFQDRMNRLFADMQTQYLKGLLTIIDVRYKSYENKSNADQYEATIDKITQMENKHLAKIKNKKNWLCIDVIRFTLGSMAKLPAYIFGLPNEIAQSFPLAQGILLSNQLLDVRKDTFYEDEYINVDEDDLEDHIEEKEPPSLLVEQLAYYFGWGTKPSHFLLHSSFSIKGKALPYENIIIKIIKNDYIKNPYRLCLFSSISDPTPPHIRMLTYDLKKSYLRAVAAHFAGDRLPLPLMPANPNDCSDAYFDEEQYNNAHSNLELKNMLNGIFLSSANHPISFATKAYLWNETFYDFITSTKSSRSNPASTSVLNSFGRSLEKKTDHPIKPLSPFQTEKKITDTRTIRRNKSAVDGSTQIPEPGESPPSPLRKFNLYQSLSQEQIIGNTSSAMETKRVGSSGHLIQSTPTAVSNPPSSAVKPRSRSE